VAEKHLGKWPAGGETFADGKAREAELAQWLIGSGRAPEAYIAAQGTAMGRAGRVRVTRTGDDIWVGGECVTVIAGEVAI
jgi:predicted PhzF superfamily epimerase YddE/YHI9